MDEGTTHPKKILIVANANPNIFSHPIFELPFLCHIAAGLNQVYKELVIRLRIVPTVKKRKNDNPVIYAIGEFIQKKLRSKNMFFKPSEIDIVMGRTNKEVSKQVDDLFFSWRHIEDDEKYKELLRYDGMSILDTGALFIHNSLKEIIFVINYISEVIEKEQPEEILVTDDDIIGEVISIIGHSKGISTTILGRFTNTVIRKFKMCGRFFINLFAFIENFKYIIRFFSVETLGTQETMKSKIMIFVACPSDVNTILPVIKVMEDKSPYELVILSINKSANRLLQEKNVPFKTFDDYWDGRLRRKIKNEEFALRTKWKVLKEDEDFINSLKYKELPLWSLIEDRIKLLFTRDLNIETVGHILDVERPNLLMTLSMGEISSLRVANKLAKMRGIPTLFVSHSVYLYDCGILNITSIDKIAVCGDDSKESLIDAGVDPQGIVVTGQPRFDVYFKEYDDFKDKIKQELNIDPTKGIILLIPQTHCPFPETESDALLKGVFRAMKEFPNHHLVVKLHPDEGDELARKVASKMKVKGVTITKDVDLVAILKSCDVVLTIFSSIGLEAIMQDKPVVIIDLTKAVASNAAKYTQGRGVVRVFSAEEIAPAIRSVLKNEKVRRDLRTYRKTVAYNMVYKPDGKASERVAELIVKMIKEKES